VFRNPSNGTSQSEEAKLVVVAVISYGNVEPSQLCFFDLVVCLGAFSTQDDEAPQRHELEFPEPNEQWVFD
jgi:hypothetical protein